MATTNYSYDARDRLLSAGSTSYTWDQNGNQLSAGSRTFTYDLGNRLKTTTSGSTTTTYSYDGEGARLQASTGTQASKKTNFLWDVTGDLPQIALERDGNNSLIRRYTYGVQRISQTAGNSTSYYLRDGLGSSANLTSSSGSTQWTWSYEPFGSIRTETKANGNQPDNFMRFTGEYLDPNGLYHLRARQYDPVSGRFLRPDPAGQSPYRMAISRYVYVADRPVVMTDPSGLVFAPTRRGISVAQLATASVGIPSRPTEASIVIPGAEAYCRTEDADASADYFDQGRLTIRLVAKCSERIEFYSISWRIGHAGMIDSDSNSFIRNWWKKTIRWNHRFEADFELSRVMTFTAQVFAYGVRVGWKGPFPYRKYLIPQPIEFKLILGPDPRLPD